MARGITLPTRCALSCAAIVIFGVVLTLVSYDLERTSQIANVWFWLILVGQYSYVIGVLLTVAMVPLLLIKGRTQDVAPATMIVVVTLVVALMSLRPLIGGAIADF